MYRKQKQKQKTKKKTKKKKKKKPIYFNTNYRKEMKQIPIIMDYCPLQFNVLKFFLRVSVHGESLPNFNFFQCKLVNFSTKL